MAKQGMNKRSFLYKFRVHLIIGVGALLLTAASMAVAKDRDSTISIDGELKQGSLVRAKVAPGAKVTFDGKAIYVDAEGRFVFGFARDDDKAHTLAWTTPDGQQHEKLLTPIQREYNIQHINGLPPKMVTPPESVLQRIRRDSAIVRAARQPVNHYDDVFGTFIWPAEGVITGVYGSQRVLNGEPKRPHFGIDLAAPTGTPVYAPAGGVITMAEDDLYYSGGTIILDHGAGVFSTFLHMSKVEVKVGERIEQGDKMGEVGATGRSTGPHLDWRINWLSMRLDPAFLVPAR